jgi:hypothetical protein
MCQRILINFFTNISRLANATKINLKIIKILINGEKPAVMTVCTLFFLILDDWLL